MLTIRRFSLLYRKRCRDKGLTKASDR
ncbi:unnamed protein product [Victoria cruziana]